MEDIKELLVKNRAWADGRVQADPEFFSRLSHQQSPKYLWIGCADSRVPANEIVGLLPGELFVHRNVANLVVHTDLNCLSVIQYAVEILQIEHIIVCGHYGCGGIGAAYTDARIGLVSNWLRHVQDIMAKHRELLKKFTTSGAAIRCLCELNVLEQALNVSQTTVVQSAWEKKQPLQIHSWVYGLDNGKIHDLGFNVDSSQALESSYEDALKRL